MKLKNSRNFLLMALLFQLFACKEAFDPSLETPETNYLVVEGFINTNGVTTIQLTRTQKLAEASVVKNESKAIVQIENDNNLVVTLTESTPGVYRSAPQALPSGRKYRLRIKTTRGREYLSEYTPVKATPKLKISWERSGDGVRIYANSADPNNQTIYYKYDYEETWSQRSTHISLYVALKFADGNWFAGARTQQEQINALICWTSALSSSVLTTSTRGLSTDAVEKFPVLFIPNAAERLAVRYSILVKQYALTNEAFDFFEQMKKNTQLLGSVFDPLPSTVRGNIKSVSNPDEPVVGYIVTASAEEQRIFIEKEEVPEWGFSIPCGIEYLPNFQPNLNLFFKDERYLILDRDVDWSKIPEEVKGYYITNPLCMDCRKRNGNNVKPSFW